jgi:hypothetical protein
VQIKTVHQALKRRGEHFLVRGLGIDRVGTGEGDAIAAKYGDATNSVHGGFPKNFIVEIALGLGTLVTELPTQMWPLPLGVAHFKKCTRCRA